MFLRFIFLILISTYATALVAASNFSSEKIMGHWFYYKKIYDGVEIPEPADATLRLHFTFFEDGTNHLWWSHVGENDLCERRGRFSIHSESLLIDEIYWVNPKNSPECQRDPDMQLGRIARTPFSFSPSGDFKIHMFLGDHTLVYVWKRIP